jgi:osmotically-inducible protein OsmY
MNTTSKLLAIAAATLVVTACGKNDDHMTVGQKVDSAIATAERKTDAAMATAEQKTESATAAVKQEMAEAKAGIADAAATVADKVEDATITASVNAELAKDPDLSALGIDVDTKDGAVQLKGSAPTEAARVRATTLAAAVKGVTRVDNMLEVRGS